MAYRRSPARVLAPLALIGAFCAVFLLVQGSPDPAPTPLSTTVAPARTAAPHPTATPATYVVRSGDTLLAIADRTGVALDRLLTLNPSVDPNTLRVGQHLRLRR